MLFLLCCNDNEQLLYGKWQVISNYYKATYEIIKENDSIKAEVLYYNDGTTIIREKDAKTYYVFKDLKASEDLFVDAMSGATKTDDSKKNIAIKIKHNDTLEVTQYIANKPLKEIWVRNK